MKTETKNTYETAEKIKENISSSAENSKKIIRELISNNTEKIQKAIDNNVQLFETVKNNIKIQGGNGEITDTVKSTFLKSLELAEDTYDAIINSYIRQMNNTIEYNNQLVDAIKVSNPENASKLLELIHQNFNQAQELNKKNTQEILDFYNKHTNLVLNFNKTFSDNVNAQTDMMHQFQSKELDMFTSWATEWWKQGYE